MGPSKGKIWRGAVAVPIALIAKALPQHTGAYSPRLSGREPLLALKALSVFGCVCQFC